MTNFRENVRENFRDRRLYDGLYMTMVRYDMLLTAFRMYFPWPFEDTAHGFSRVRIYPPRQKQIQFLPNRFRDDLEVVKRRRRLEF